mgnify:CR=1 FL=1
MKRWLQLAGDFKQNEEKLIFHGGEIDLPSGDKGWKSGMILFEDKMLSGVASFDVEFESSTLEPEEEAELIFNYVRAGDFICTGITGKPYKYEVKRWSNGMWQTLGITGNFTELPKNKFNIEVKLNNSLICLMIDKIMALQIPIPCRMEKTNIGIWASGKRKIIFSNFKIDAVQAEAFVISQYGGVYDQLYNEVIKPVCEHCNVKVTRADEVNSSSLILADIVKTIQKSNFIIADITPDNPNVFYELGYAHALKKEVILLCDKSHCTSLPLDISGYRVLLYDNTMSGKRLFEEQMQNYVSQILEYQGIK